MFNGAIHFLQSSDINVVGIIDNNKVGQIEVGGKSFKIYTAIEAYEKYGNQATIIITIANAKSIKEIEESLVNIGFLKDRIYDVNVYSWLTIPSKKSYCSFTHGWIVLVDSALNSCCPSTAKAFFNEWYFSEDNIENSIDRFLKKREYYIEQSRKGRIPRFCKNCPHLSDFNGKSDKVYISVINYADSSMCNSDCVYCSYRCSNSRYHYIKTAKERMDGIIKILNRLDSEKLINENTLLNIASGEITIHPHKNNLYRTIQNLRHLNIDILSNCFLYDKEIAEILRTNKKSRLLCDLDAGTIETYIKVKGFNKFHDVWNNLKKYSKYGRVDLKYILIPDLNDSMSDYYGTVNLMKDIGINFLSLSCDFEGIKNYSDVTLRKLCFSTAQFMYILKDNGINFELNKGFWVDDNAKLVNRFFDELQSV